MLYPGYPVNASEFATSEPAYDNPELYDRIYDGERDEMITIDRAVLNAISEEAYHIGRAYHIGPTWNTSGVLLAVLTAIGPVCFLGPVVLGFVFNYAVARWQRGKREMSVHPDDSH